MATIHGSSGNDLTHAKAALGLFWTWLTDSGYRPERHYMRGGRTPGSRLAAGRPDLLAPRRAVLGS